MKITAARLIVCSPDRNFVTLKIETDEGIYGLGDATVNGRELAVASYLSEHVLPCLIGRDPFQIEDIWQYLYRGAYWRRGPVTMAAIGRLMLLCGISRARRSILLFIIFLAARAATACSFIPTPMAATSRRLSTPFASIWTKAILQFARSLACRG